MFANSPGGRTDVLDWYKKLPAPTSMNLHESCLSVTMSLFVICFAFIPSKGLVCFPNP